MEEFLRKIRIEQDKELKKQDDEIARIALRFYLKTKNKDVLDYFHFFYSRT